VTIDRVFSCKNFPEMKKKPKIIGRRSFITSTGVIAAGMTLIPVSLPGSLPGKGENIPPTVPESGSEGIKVIGEPATGKSLNPSEVKWWEKAPLRIVELEEGYTPAEKMELLKKLGANVEHVVRFVDTSPGTSFLDAHNLYEGDRVNFRNLKDYLTEAHRNGIRVIIYFNVHAILSSYAHQHPEWQQIKDDGKSIEDVYSVDSSFCINSGWREEVFGILRKLAGYEIDGLFYDGPIFFSQTCYCGSCKKLFREKYNREIPIKTELSSMRDTQEWRDLIDFQSDSIARFLRDSNKILKEANPQILLYMNGNTLAPSWPTGRDNRKIIKETDILGAEGGFLYGEMTEPIYKPGAMAKLLETQAEGKPAVVFDAAKQGPWTFSTLPPGEISILYSQTITHQANVWLAICDSPQPHPEEMAVIRKYNRFISENPDPFFRTKSLSRIALVWPQEAGNFYGGSSVPMTDFTKEMKTTKAGNLNEEFYGFYDGLSRIHSPFDVLDEVSLENDPGRYDLIILPNATCLRQKATDNIKKFVREGGNLISTFETSFYNENGRRLDEIPLNEVFGVEKTGSIFGPLSWDYAVIADPGHFSLKGIGQKYIYAPVYGLQQNSKLKAPLYFTKPLPGSYAASPSKTEYPFLIENRYGKGRSVYMAGTFGGSLLKFHFPEYYRILANLVAELSEPPITLESVPSSVEVNLRKRNNSVYVYLINFTSEMKRPVERIIPLSNLRINVPLKPNPKSVRALWSGKDLPFKMDGGSISFTLPVIEDYEVVEIRI